MTKNIQKFLLALTFTTLVCLFIQLPLFHQNTVLAVKNSPQAKIQKIKIRQAGLLRIPKNIPQEYFYDSGIKIPYPVDGVKGIYVQTALLDSTMDNLSTLLDSTNLNAIVVDVRDDGGNIILDIPVEKEMTKKNIFPQVNDTAQLMKDFEKHQIYPIARIVSFKDDRLARQHPELSFTTANGTVWKDGGGASFINPFKKENWDYALDVAIASAKMGFKEIQLDYVRFPEGFETFCHRLTYDRGDYAHYEDENEARIAAISDFIGYIHEALKPYGVKLSVDLFGYATMIDEAGGIGQNFSKIAENVDVVSAMIYPSHWGKGTFGVPNPDLQPYDVISGYMLLENSRLAKVNPAPISRPWIQDFTATYLGKGNYQVYSSEQVEAQIRALQEAGVNEYLIWNALAQYSSGTNY